MEDFVNMLLERRKTLHLELNEIENLLRLNGVIIGGSKKHKLTNLILSGLQQWIAPITLSEIRRFCIERDNSFNYNQITLRVKNMVVDGILTKQKIGNKQPVFSIAVIK